MGRKEDLLKSYAEYQKRTEVLDQLLEQQLELERQFEADMKEIMDERASLKSELWSLLKR